jgi:hypothetical protein
VKKRNKLQDLYKKEMKGIFNLLILLYVINVFFSCSPFNKDKPQELFNLIFADGGKKNPKILFMKEVNLDLTPEIEFCYIVRNGNEEILVVLDNSKKMVLFKQVFALLNIGPIVYDPAKNKWIASSAEMKPDSLYIIKSLLFTKLKGDSYNSIFLEVLSEEPPLELFSVPLVYKNYKLVFDGFSLFKETKLLKELNRIPISFIPDKKGIQVLSSNPKFEKFYSLE